MSSNETVIADLEQAKTTLQHASLTATGNIEDNLMITISNIADEIGQLVLVALSDDYVPQTDAFKGGTQDAKNFVDTLNAMKNDFAAASAIASALDTVLKYIK